MDDGNEEEEGEDQVRKWKMEGKTEGELWSNWANATVDKSVWSELYTDPAKFL